MKCKLVDVFAKQKLAGNGLTIFYETGELTAQRMLALTQEMRQFESIFLSRREDGFRTSPFSSNRAGLQGDRARSGFCRWCRMVKSKIFR